VASVVASAPVPSASAQPSASASAHPVPLSTGLAVAPRVVERSIQLDLTPSMGVTVVIDGAESRPVDSGAVLRLDGKAHSLAFTCSVCTLVQRDVAAGEKDETLVVKVPIKPGTLDIQGPVDKTYQIVEHPEVAVRAGRNTVPLRSSFEWVTIKQIDSNATTRVRLAAGKAVQATF
jgi:hypothetical protein